MQVQGNLGELQTKFEVGYILTICAAKMSTTCFLGPFKFFIFYFYLKINLIVKIIVRIGGTIEVQSLKKIATKWIPTKL